MESVKHRMALTKINRNGREYTALIVLDQQRRFTELSVFEPEEDSILDRIVIARVDKVVPGISAAFVHISPKQKAYLPLENLKTAIFTKRQSQKKEICEGDELIVQVTKEAVKTKDPVVSAKLTLTGKYCLLMPSADIRIKFSISRKIKGEERKNLQQFLAGLQEKLCLKTQDNPFEEQESMSPDEKMPGATNNSGLSLEVLLRTNCLQASEDELREDILNQIQDWERICAKAAHQSVYTLLNAPLTGYIRHMQSLSYDDIDFVYTDNRTIYDCIKEALPYLNSQGKLVFYQDSSLPLSVLYHIEGNIDSLTSNKVWLSSGGNIIIEQLETMTVIDVNSAKSSANREAMLKANLEAAKEIPRQLRLRNISGMIIVDFINMDDVPEDEAQFIDVLKKELRKDTVQANFIDITKLGLVEITRKKIRKSLKEVFS